MCVLERQALTCQKRKVNTMSKSYRSAITGKYVKKSYAKRNPKTTVGEARKPKGKKKGGK